MTDRDTRGVTSVSHDRGEEDLLAKARWFAQFSPPERLRMLIEWADAMLDLNPKIQEADRRIWRMCACSRAPMGHEWGRSVRPVPRPSMR